MGRTASLFAVVATAMLLALGGVALAATSVSGVPDAASVQVDGRVSAIVVSGGRVYLGGSFTHVNGLERNRLASIDAKTGELTDWNPNANGNVMSLAASADGTRVYAGGAFTAVGGLTHRRLVSLDTATGAPDEGFRIGLGAPVRAIVASGRRLYIGGDFTVAKGQSRSYLALVDGMTGALDQNWAPAADARVRALALSPEGTRLYAGGDFNSISGDSAPYLAGLDASNKGGLLWRTLVAPNGPLFGVVAQGTGLYSAEAGLGGAAAAYDAATGARSWTVKGDGDVQSVALLGGEVYIGGHFINFGGQSRRFFAAVDATTGALAAWNPTGGGSTSGSLGTFALVADPMLGRIYAGGEFTKVSGAEHQHFAQFSQLK